MPSVDKLVEISSKIEHLESAAEWITRQTVHTDNTISQTGTLILTIAEDVRSKLYELVRELETSKLPDKNMH